MTVIGTRPEAIKLAPVVMALNDAPRIESLVCITAQHRQMLDQTLDLFGIRVDFDLDVMNANQDLFDVTALILNGMQSLLKSVRPDIILVHGDTTTSFVAALSAFYEKILIGHVEAGLRTHDIYSPWPEEGNRCLTAAIANLHFAPTESARQNLIGEGVPSDTICVTGNTVIDALHQAIARLEESESLRSELAAQFHYLNVDKRLVLITGHRRENFGDGFNQICGAIKQLALDYTDVEFIYPVHLNPNVREPVFRILDGLQNVFLVEPLDYLTFVYVMNLSYLILTDSGGVQEEAPSLGKPVLVLRNCTERPEAVTSGTVRLVGTSTEAIVESVSEMLSNESSYRMMRKSINPYGDGNASARIVDFLSKWPS